MPTNNLSLLLLLARVEPAAEVIEEGRSLIRKGIAWEDFFRLSAIHGLAPLVYRNLDRLGDLPDEVLQLFKRAYLSNIADTARSSRQLYEITRTLEDAGIEYISLKGVTTADRVFGGPSSYPSSDLDLLIRRRDIGPALETLGKSGYSAACEVDDFYIDNYEDIQLFKTGAKSVEIHPRLGQRRYFSIPDEYWWEAPSEWTLDGHVYRVLPVDKNLFFLSLHLFGHGYAPLKFIVTIAEMLKSDEGAIDWQRLLEFASSAGADMPLLLSCYLAGSLLDAPIPPKVEEVLKRLSPGERWIFEKIRGKVHREDASFSKIMFLLTVLQYDLPEVLRRLLRWLFPPLKEVAYRYNLPPGSPKVYGYYLLNPLLLLFKKRDL